MDNSTPVAEPPITSAPVMDVKPPAPTHLDHTDKPAKADTAAQHSKPPVPKPVKQPTPGVGAAIFATVVIVLALAAMATYAYVKTK